MIDLRLDPGELFAGLNDGEELFLRVQGSSMSPFLRDGRDTVVLTKPVKLSKGAIVVFRRGDMFIMHRVVRVDGEKFTARGDNLSAPETDIPAANAAAMVKCVIRNGKKITPRSPLWFFHARVFSRPAVRKLASGLLSRR